MNTGKTDLKSLKLRVGRQPFDQRLRFNSLGFASCPFHTSSGGPSETLHLKQYATGWQATCFSCKWKGDALKFVQEKDGVDFKGSTHKTWSTSTGACERAETTQENQTNDGGRVGEVG